MKYIDEAKRLRAIASPHYNCAQAVVIPFAKDAGLSDELAYDIARNFGAGMKMGGTCGAITGGLMVLGLFKADDPQTIAAYYRHFRNNHENRLNCSELLAASRQRGEVKKVHCDGMVYEAVQVVYDILNGKGLLS